MSLYLAVFGKPRYLGLVDIEDSKIEEQRLSAGRWIVVETLRGLEMALLGGTLSREQEDKYRRACLDETSDEHTKGPEPMLQEVTLVGSASDFQIKEHEARRADEESVLVRSRQILHSHQFQMKLVDVEYTMDRKKLFFYFTSEQRVDFRAYVRDLAKEFRLRIEMRQIGVRDEAKTVRGVSPCGRPCCCSYWLHRFTPINIRMVKEQNLALNPTKISGICGRLMCCMFYEHSTYGELWRNLPAPGSKIKAPQGNYVLEGVDLRTETARVSLPEGGEAAIPIADFAAFKETILRGETWRKEEEKDADEPDRKPVRGVMPRVLPPRLQRPAHERAKIHEAPDDSGKNVKKIKPEKISIEEHIAERVNAEMASHEKAGASPRPLQSQPVPRAEGNAQKRQQSQQKRKDPPAAPRRQEGQPRAVQEIKERRVTEQRPKRETADTGGAPAGGPQDQSSHTNRFHNHRRPRRKDGGHERPGSGNAGSGNSGAAKGDS